MLSFLRILTLSLLCLTAAACGKTGDLYLPGDPPPGERGEQD